MQSSDRSLGCVNVTEIQFCREVIDTPVTAQQYFASGSVQITDNLTLETLECKSRLKSYMINWLPLFTKTQLSFIHLFRDKLMEWKGNGEQAREVSDSHGSACSTLKPLKYGCDSPLQDAAWKHFWHVLRALTFSLYSLNPPALSTEGQTIQIRKDLRSISSPCSCCLFQIIAWVHVCRLVTLQLSSYLYFNTW